MVMLRGCAGTVAQGCYTETTTHDKEALSWVTMSTTASATPTHAHAQRSLSLRTLQPELAEQVQHLQLVSKAANTRRAYAADWSRWAAWCTSKGLPALPASPEVVAAYLADHAGVLSVATLRRHLATISKAHQTAGQPSPCRSSLVADCVQGLRRQHGRPPAAAPPLLADQLRATLEAVPSTGAAALRDRALLLLGWCAALRRSELATLRWGNVSAQADGLVLTLEHSKTDHAGEGQQVPVPQQANPALCPVRALEAWKAYCQTSLGAEAVQPDQPVLRRVTKQGRVLVTGLSGQAVAAVVQRRTAAAGLEGHQGHSLRVGLIWEASQAGVPDSALMQTTRHQGVTMLRRYQREAGLMDRAASRGLL